MLNVQVPKIETQGKAEAVAPAPVVAPSDPMRVTLRKSIITHAGPVHELKFREPVGSDYIEIGELPFDVRGNEESRRMRIDFKVAAKWIARLSGLDELLVGQLTADDWIDATGKVNVILMRIGVTDLGNSGD